MKKDGVKNTHAVTWKTIKGLTREERNALKRFVGDGDISGSVFIGIISGGVLIPNIRDGVVER